MSKTHLPIALVADAPGKMMLLGEYAVLEGAPALVAATEARAKVTFLRTKVGSEVSLSAENLGLQTTLAADAAGHLMASENVPRALGLATQILRGLSISYPFHFNGLKISIDTQDFYHAGTKLGLGSSAALTAALRLGLLAVASAPEAPSTAPMALWQSAQDFHQSSQQGVGSGADVAASLWGGRICFRRKPGELGCEVTRLPPLAQEGTLFAVFTGKSAVTQNFLKLFYEKKRRDPKAFWALLEPLGALAQAGSEIWQLRQVIPLLPLWRAYQKALIQLGNGLGANLVTDEHHVIAQICEKASCAYKVSGAGGGDIGVALCPSPQVANKLMRRLRGQGRIVLPSSVTAPGARVREL